MNSFIKNKLLGLFVKANGFFSKLLVGGKAQIFMLHRVLPENLRIKYDYNKDLAITPEALESFIKLLLKKGFKFIALDELSEKLKSRKWGKDKYICFTLDDGYRDNITYGLPIFEKYQVPITIYVTNCFPNGTAHFWWYWLEEKIKNEKEITFREKTYLIKTEEEKLNAYNSIREQIKNCSPNDREELTTNFFNKSEESIAKECEELALNWEELKTISNHSLITLGAHTSNHYSLANLTDSEMQKEIGGGKIELEKKIEKNIRHFAYPYGSLKDANNREFNLIKSLGFKTATLNHPGNVFTSSLSNSFFLPRYALGNNTTLLRFEYYLNGIQHFSTNGWSKKPIE
jgi:peptidoglycan/xylan/chitin deacetylase (PgdA/CDA1 family)